MMHITIEVEDGSSVGQVIRRMFPELFGWNVPAEPPQSDSDVYPAAPATEFAEPAMQILARVEGLRKPRTRRTKAEMAEAAAQGIPAEASTPQGSNAAAEPTQQDVFGITQRMCDHPKIGLTGVLDLLERYEAKKVSAVRADDFPAYLRDAGALLAEAGAA